MLHHILYCGNCDEWTLQHVWDSGHERDGSNDWQECSVCHWIYSGFTARWLSPSPLRYKELRLLHEPPEMSKDST
jgi:hypothetical protein